MAGSSAMPVWAVIPVKPLHLGKSRLLLPEAERIAVNRAFLHHVLETVTAVLPPLNVIVISGDEEALTMARRAGARALCEFPHCDLNMALALGARFAADYGAGAVLSVASDLPYLTSDDLRAMLDAFLGNNLVLAPDKSGTGTNAILMAPNRLPYRHGADSLWRHLEAARQAGLRFTILRREGLMRDVDRPDQLPAGFPPRGAEQTRSSSNGKARSCRLPIGMA